MLTNQKFILFLSLIILSFSAEPEEEDFDKRIEEEPQLIGITKGIVEKTKQTVGLISKIQNWIQEDFKVYI